MLKVGITGGIGAGKSIIGKLFQLYGINIYNADYFAKYLMQNDAALIHKIKTLFGEDVYSNKKLNRKKLAEIVFVDSTKLQQLNAAVHPVVAKHSQFWMEKQTGSYLLKEAALLFETGSYQQLDYTILVTAPEKIRIARVMQRDKTTAESVRNRIKKQMPDSEKKMFSNFIITNDNSHPIIPQVNILHKKFLELSMHN